MSKPAPFPLQSDAAPSALWQAAPGAWPLAWSRLRRLFWLKALGLTVFMTVFFMLYFHLLRHPVRPVLPMPVTALDTWLGYQPWAVWPYLSLWVYLGLAPMLLHRFKALVVYTLWNVLLCGLGLAAFYGWPTSVPVFAHQASVAWPNSVLVGIDAAGNACPSLHVATAVFCGLWAERVLRQLGLPLAVRIAQGGWLLLIVFSTLAIKQHVVWDVVAGVALALAVGLPSLRLAGQRIS